MRLKSVGHPALADARVKAVQVQRDGTSPATSPERVIQVLAVPPLAAPVLLDLVLTDRRVLAGVAVGALVGVAVGALVGVQVAPEVAQEVNLVVAQEASPQGNPVHEQAANQGEVDLRARGKRCGSRKRPENRCVTHWENHSLVPPNDSSQSA